MDSGSDLVCQAGRVKRLEGAVAYVLIEKPSDCETCAARSGCAMLSGGGRLIAVRNEAGAAVGQQVELGLKPAAVVTASFLLFILPASALVVGIVAGYMLAEQFDWPAREWIGFVIGAAAFALVLIVIRLLSPRFERSGRYEPVITRIIG